MMRLTSRPATLPASLVAWRWSSLKYAGTVMTAAVDRVAEVGLGVGLQLLQDHRADLGRRVLLAARLDARVAVRAGDDLVGDDRLLLAHLGLLAAHEALDGEDGVLRVGDRLALGDGADEALAALREGDDGRGGATALGVLDDGRLAALEDGHARVRRAEVDADGLGHGCGGLLLACCSAFGSGTREILASFAQILPARLAPVRDHAPGEVVRQRVPGRRASRCGPRPAGPARARAQQRVRQQLAAEPQALEGRQQADVRQLDAVAPGRSS